MRSGFKLLCSALVLAASLPAMAAPHARRGPTSPHLFNKRTASTRPAVKPAAQRGIDPERTTQIQTALIKQGYMTGEPTGKWDTNTQDAVQKLQGDNGWQTKLVPDSRAIIKLGLGPGSTPESSTSALSASPSSEKMAPLPFAGETESPTPAQR